MQIPLSWLREYVDVPFSAKELAHRLTMAGLEIGGVEHVGSQWEQVFVGHVEAIEPHPNSDHLKLATVNLGKETFKVVCGAPNVAAGQNIAYAHIGAKLTDPNTKKPTTLKAARIRGIVSEGMICSERELGLSEEHTGIMVLPADAPLGISLGELLGDTVLDAEPTANRPDWFSILGVAYEVAAITSTAVREPEAAYPESSQDANSLFRVHIEAPDLCPRYVGALVRGVKVGPSPAWLQQRLTRAGMRPINNVVDVTNFVMLEYGQPMHAFDFAKLKGHRVVVRRAGQGEVITTLDGQERKLDSSMLVIADDRDAVAVAGVMGGANSEVSSGTVDILLESASFHPINTRKTAQALKLRTEASLRFEKGARPDLPPLAMGRAVQFILQTAGGQAARGFVDVYPGKRETAPITLTQHRIKQVLGVEVPIPEMELVLFPLGFRAQRVPHHALPRETPHRDTTDVLHVTVPPWRSDITIEEDLVEEVARIRGYDAVPLVPLSTPIPLYQPNPARDLKEHVRDELARCTLEEIITYSLVSKEDHEKACAPQNPVLMGREPLKVANPLSAERDTLRVSLLPGLLKTLAANRRVTEGPLNLFEVGRVYLPQPVTAERPVGLPDEREMAVAVLFGPRTVPGWRHDEGIEDFFESKGVAEALIGNLGLRLAVDAANAPWCAPGHGAAVTANGARIGFLGEVHPLVLEAFDIDAGPVAVLEIDLAALLKVVEAAGETRKFKPLPRFPGAWRDLAMLLDREVPAARVERALHSNPLVADVALIDVYEGQQVPAGKRSLAYRVLLQSPNRTLTGDEVSEAMAELWRALKRDVNAEPRS
ncbi:MAG: phenylalanine--tRNA ligase subunit beta [Dehalococcoidia bacterium]|nr:phenylalanine--tRNA ligase subunit beta [Dehalococcoidia bacterium]